MPSPIQIGVIGLSAQGWATNTLVPPILQSPDYVLTALSTRSAASAAEAAQKYSALTQRDVKPFHGDTAQIAEDPDVDLVAIAVKASSHKQAAMPVIAAGKDIYLAWPCGNGTQDTVELLEASQKQGIRTMVGMQGRHCPVLKKVKEVVTSGKIGRILSSTVLLSVPKEFNFGGPCVTERAPYTADATSGATILEIAVGQFLASLTDILGDISSVMANTHTHYSEAIEMDASGQATGRVLPKTAPDHISFSGALKSSAFLSFHCRGGHPSTTGRLPFSWLIDGEEGSIMMSNDIPSGSFVHVMPPVLHINGEKIEFGEDKVGNVRRAWDEFAKGTEGDYATLEDAVRIHRVLDAVTRSAKEGIKVDIEY